VAGRAGRGRTALLGLLVVVAVLAAGSGQAVKGLFKGISVVDEHTLLIELNQPWAAFVVDRINAAATNIWLYWNPFSLIVDEDIHGLEQARAIPFTYANPKTWFGELWRG
jgi:hypothetical protein